jgi:copper transport protein
MSRSGEKAMPRLVSVAAIVLVAWCAAAAPAGAHVSLVSAAPSDGTSVAVAPRELRLRFDEAIAPRFRRVLLLDGRGRVVEGSSLRAAGPRGLVLSVPRLPRGPYEITWEVVAAGDGHVTGGAVSFGVGAAAAAAGSAGRAAGADPVEAVLRWLDVAALALLVGGLGIRAVVVRTVAADAAARRARRAAVAGAGVALALGGALLARQASAVMPTLPRGSSWLDALGEVLGARWGSLWTARELLLAILVVVAVLLRGRGRAPALEAGALAGVIGVCVARALGGHAAAVDGAAVHVAAAAVHLLAATVWIGAVVVLAIVSWPAGAIDGAASRMLVRALCRPLAWTAGASVVLVGATGLYAAGAQVASLDALLAGGYGTTLIVKVALAAVACAFGAANFLALRRLGHHPRTRPHRLIAAEAVVGIEVLLAAGVMAAGSPPRGPQWAPPRPVRAPVLVGQSRDVLVSAEVRPNRPGRNVVTVLAASNRRPEPAPITRVTLTDSRGGHPVALTPVAPGRWAGGVQLDRPGHSEVGVEVRREGERLPMRLAWSVEPPDPARAVRISARPLAPLLDRAALALLLLAAAGALAPGLVARLRRLHAQPVLGKEAS